ncbi:hypothetical protein D3C73_1066080 [compost metagenome]
MPGGEGRTIAAQVQHGAGNLLDLADAPHRMHGIGKLAFFRVSFIGPAEHIGIDDRRAHRIHTDFLLGVFDGCRFGQADHRVFRCRINAHLRRGAETCDRSRIDDRTAALGQQQRQLIFHAQPDAFDIDAHDRVELIERALGQFAFFDLDTGIVEGIVEAAIGIDHLIHQIFYIAFQRDIAAHEGRIAAGGTNQRHCAFTTRRVHVRNHHFQAFGSERLCGRTPDTIGGTRYDSNLAGKRHAHCFVLEVMNARTQSSHRFYLHGSTIRRPVGFP